MFVRWTHPDDNEAQSPLQTFTVLTTLQNNTLLTTLLALSKYYFLTGLAINIYCFINYNRASNVVTSELRQDRFCNVVSSEFSTVQVCNGQILSGRAQRTRHYHLDEHKAHTKRRRGERKGKITSASSASPLIKGAGGCFSVFSAVSKV